MRSPEAPACTAHRLHRPKALTREAHHVIPQAWQQVFVPPAGTVVLYPGRGDHGRLLWDDRTVLLCPTGHRNVHVHIVAGMRNLGYKARGREYGVAMLALSRFVAAGGDLQVLRDVGLWGQA